MFFFNEFLYRPLLNALFFIYGIIPVADMGIAIILLTLVVRVILLPPTLKSVKAQRGLAQLQPKVEELKKRLGNDKERMAAALMELYKKERVNPLSSCLPLLIQLPLLWALYRVFQQGFAVPADGILYSFVAKPETISPLFLGVINLARPSLILVVLTAAAQYAQTKMLPTQPPAITSAGSTDERRAAMMNRQMQLLGPVLTVAIGFTLPSALILYWLVSTLAQVGIQWYGLRPNRGN